MDADIEICRPKVLVVNAGNPAAYAHAEVGTLIMSGAKLYVAVTAGAFELVTSS